jgi:hypothetical protein
MLSTSRSYGAISRAPKRRTAERTERSALGSIASSATTVCDASRHVSRRRSNESPACRPSSVSGKKKNRRFSSEFSGLPATCQTANCEECLG